MAFFADLLSLSLPPFPTAVPSVHIGHFPHHPSHPPSEISPFFLRPLLPFIYLSCIHLRHHQVTCLIRLPFLSFCLTYPMYYIHYPLAISIAIARLSSLHRGHPYTVYISHLSPSVTTR